MTAAARFGAAGWMVLVLATATAMGCSGGDEGDDGGDESSDGSDDDGDDGSGANRCEVTVRGDAASGIATETWTIGCLGATCSPNDAVFGTYSDLNAMPYSVVGCLHNEVGPGMRPVRNVDVGANFPDQRLEDLVPLTLTNGERMAASMTLYTDPDDLTQSMSWNCDADTGEMTLSLTRAEPVDNGNIVTDYLIDGEVHAVCPADPASDAAGTLTIDAVF